VASAAQIPDEKAAKAAVLPAAAAAASGRPQIASFPSVLETNPYQRLLYGELATLGYELAPDAELSLGWLLRERRRTGFLHFHWPQPFWRHDSGPAFARRPLSYLKLGLFAMRLAAAHLLGYRVAWTIHQVYPHERESGRLDRLGALVLAHFADTLIAHDRGTRAAAGRELRRAGRKVAVVPHGAYIGVYPPGRGRDAAREELGIPAGAFALLCFGDLRAYKEVDCLLAAFSATARPDAALLVAGTVCASEHGEAVLGRAAADSRIRPLLGFVPDDRVADVFAAADAAVVARGDGGTSGSLILALSMGVPVVAARTEVYTELLDGGAAGWLFEPGDTRSLRAAIEEAAAAGPEERRRKGAAAFRQAEKLRWPEIGARTAELLAGGGR
jgi:beta-1,4-mannosyltransferase